MPVWKWRGNRGKGNEQCHLLPRKRARAQAGLREIARSLQFGRDRCKDVEWIAVPGSFVTEEPHPGLLRPAVPRRGFRAPGKGPSHAGAEVVLDLKGLGNFHPSDGVRPGIESGIPVSGKDAPIQPRLPPAQAAASAEPAATASEDKATAPKFSFAASEPGALAGAKAHPAGHFRDSLPELRIIPVAGGQAGGRVSRDDEEVRVLFAGRQISHFASGRTLAVCFRKTTDFLKRLAIFSARPSLESSACSIPSCCGFLRRGL